jgi:hypothetical protein
VCDYKSMYMSATKKLSFLLRRHADGGSYADGGVRGGTRFHSAGNAKRCTKNFVI